MFQSEILRYVLIVPVWGDEYIEVFTETALPFTLTEGNSGFFRQRTDIVFKIVTNAVGYLRMRDRLAIRSLQRDIRTEFVLMDDRCDLTEPHKAMSEAYRMAMDDKRVRNGFTTFIYLTADSFWSNGTFRRIDYLISAGKKVVAVAGLRANRDEVAAALANRIDSNGVGEAIETQDLVTLALDNLHTMSSAHDILSSQFLNQWPSHVYWISQSTLVARCFHLHPLAVVSPRGAAKFRDTIDGDLLLSCRYPMSQIHVVCNSTEIFGLELSSKEKTWNVGLTAPSLAKICEFANLHCNYYHRMFFMHSIRMTGRGNDDTDCGLIEEHEISVVEHVKRTFVIAWLLETLKVPQVLRIIRSNKVNRRVLSPLIRRIKRLPESGTPGG